MNCTYCGKQIEDNSKSCPYCGNALSASDTESAKEALKKTAGAVMGSVKAIDNSVNTATGGQPQKYVEPAKELPKSPADVVKQVVQDKNTSNFFTKNKYRNIKIIAVLLVAVFLFSFLLGKDENAKQAKDAVFADVSADTKCNIKSVKRAAAADNGNQIYVVKFTANGAEHAGVVVIHDDSAEIEWYFPKSEYSQMEKYIEDLKASY